MEGNLRHSPSLANTLLGRLQQWAIQRPEHLAYAFLEAGEVVDALTFAKLNARVQGLALTIERCTQRHDRVLLLLNPGLNYVVAFLACLWGQRVAVTAYAPTSDKNSGRLRAMAMDAEPALVLYPEALASKVQQLVGGGSARMMSIEAAQDNTQSSAQSDAENFQDQTMPSIKDVNDLAFLQYTSGSTSSPKGVMVSHANLWHNAQAIYQRFGHSLESRVVSWLPPYHDMGLIGGILQSLYGGFSSYLMSPIEFLQRPQRWLQAIARYGATSSGGPNFAYQLCVDRIKDEHLQGVNLSQWAVAFNGAEPIGAHTLQRFAQRFGPWGFKPTSWFPCYGLAEATLLVASGKAGAGARTLDFAAQDLAENRAVPSKNHADNAAEQRTLVGCGQVVEGHELCIVNPHTGAPCAQGDLGEICVRGPSVAQGYWRKPEHTADSFYTHNNLPWLRTGDLGFVQGGELFVNGRLKDLIIIKGVNYYPSDIEHLLHREGLVQGFCATAAVAVLHDEAEKLVVVLEVDAKNRQAMGVEQRLSQVRTLVFDEFKLTPHAVLALRAGSLPRTSSGKIQRQQCAAWSALALVAVAEDAPWPSALAPWAPHLLAVAVAGRVAYAAHSNSIDDAKQALA